jgi:hypothetical protein
VRAHNFEVTSEPHLAFVVGACELMHISARQKKNKRSIDAENIRLNRIKYRCLGDQAPINCAALLLCVFLLLLLPYSRVRHLYCTPSISHYDIPPPPPSTHTIAQTNPSNLLQPTQQRDPQHSREENQSSVDNRIPAFQSTAS